MNQGRAIRLAQKGDESGFAWLFERHRRSLFRYVRSIERLTVEEANDVLQNTFTRAFMNISSLADATAYDGWLLTIARRETYRYVARVRSKDEPLETTPDVACERRARLEEEAERGRLLAAIREAVDAVEPEEVRETARAYYLSDEKRTAKSIAEELDVPHATVRKRLFLFRNKLRARLVALLEEE